jgi:hypothetical protein
MGIGDMVDKAKAVVKDRGGHDAAKEDATEAHKNVTQDASLQEKAKDTAEDIRDPGAPDGPDRP